MLRLLRHIALAFFKAVVHTLVISWQAVYNLTCEVWHQIILLHFLKMWNAWTWRHTLIYITSLTTYNQHCFLGFVWTEFGKLANLVDFGFSCQASSMVLILLPRNWIPSSASGRREDEKTINRQRAQCLMVDWWCCCCSFTTILRKTSFGANLSRGFTQGRS